MIDLEQRRAGPLRRVVRKAAEIIPLSLPPTQVLPRLDRGFFRLTRGRTTLSAWLSGLPIVMLTTRELAVASHVPSRYWRSPTATA